MKHTLERIWEEDIVVEILAVISIDVLKSGHIDHYNYPSSFSEKREAG